MRALVTGGGGFLGSVVVGQLLARGDSVRLLARGEYRQLRGDGVETIRGDVADYEAVRTAVAGCDVVFHVAARAGSWGPYKEYYATNVTGTENVVRACLAEGVSRLVFTSTPSVVHSGHGIAGGDESLPYAKRYSSSYAETKSIAEKHVLASASEQLATVALRPHLVWGPGDNQLTPRILERARSGMLRLVGDGSNLVDSTYVDDAARAHLLAADRLSPTSALQGRAYFISQGDPRPLRELVNDILKAAGLPPVTATIPVSVAWAVGALSEVLSWATRREEEPLMTRFVARQLATEHWFDISAARRDLGYEPMTTIEYGMEKLSRHLRGNPDGRRVA